MQQLLAHCVSASTLAGISEQCFLWSEKTTVCRIFNCQRVRVKLPAISVQLSAGGGRLRGSFPPNLCGLPGALPLDQPSNLTSPHLRDASWTRNLFSAKLACQPKPA
jgi:hypothetical protein